MSRTSCLGASAPRPAALGALCQPPPHAPRAPPAEAAPAAMLGTAPPDPSEDTPDVEIDFDSDSAAGEIPDEVAHADWGLGVDDEF